MFSNYRERGSAKKNPQCIHSRGVYMPVGNLSADMPIPHITKIYFRLNLNVWKNLIFIIPISKRIPLKFLELNNKAKSFDWLQKLFDVLLNPTWKLKMCAGATKMQCLRARGYIYAALHWTGTKIKNMYRLSICLCVCVRPYDIYATDTQLNTNGIKWNPKTPQHL